jgi:hypothetical protein
MRNLAKVLRWYFGIEALILFAAPALALWNTPSIRPLHPDGMSPQALVRVWAALAILVGAQLALAATFGMAWWTLPKGKTSSRVWAITASLLNIPLFWIYPPMWISTAAGIVGLCVFSRREALAWIASPARPPRVTGDGTSRLVDLTAQLATVGGVVAGWSWWSRWAETKNLSMVHGLPFLLEVVLASLITTAAHESGHVLAGWASGMKLRTLSVGPFEWRLRGGRWEFQFHPAGFLLNGGATGMVRANPYDRQWAEVALLAGGPFTSLLLGAITLWATLAAKGRVWEQVWQLLAFVTTFSLLAFVINLIPLRPEAHYSDGARIYQLLWGGPWADVYRAFSIVGSSLASPLRPKDYDIEVIQRAARFVTHGQQALLLRLFAYLYFFDSGRIPDALHALGEAESVYTQDASAIPAELHTSFIFATAFLRRDAPTARLWWERMEAKQQMEAKKSPRLSADYWKALTALLWIEDRVEEARTAWAQGNEVAQKLPDAGAYEFDRFCFAQLRQVLEASPVPVPRNSLARILMDRIADLVPYRPYELRVIAAGPPEKWLDIRLRHGNPNSYQVPSARRGGAEGFRAGTRLHGHVRNVWTSR